MTLRSIRAAAALAVLPLVLSGCGLLFAGISPLDPFTGPFGDPGNLGGFERGRATLEMSTDGEEQTVVLDQVFGSRSVGFTYLTWSNDDGWSMTLTYADSSAAPGPLGLDGDITFDRMGFNQYWTTGYDQSMSLCTIDVAESTSDRISGSSECEMLRWVDGFGNDSGLIQPYVEGQPQFDVHVTFEAEPLGNVQTS